MQRSSFLYFLKHVSTFQYQLLAPSLEKRGAASSEPLCSFIVELDYESQTITASSPLKSTPNLSLLSILGGKPIDNAHRESADGMTSWSTILALSFLSNSWVLRPAGQLYIAQAKTGLQFKIDKLILL